MKTLFAVLLAAPIIWAQQTTNQNIYDVRLTYNASPNGYTTTTGSISASSHTLTVASATGWGVGMGVLVTGGCVSGCTTQASGTFLWTYVTVISGTTLTLNDAAGASVSGGRVAHDETRAINAAQAAAYNSGGGKALLSKDPITGNCIYKVSGPLNSATNSVLTTPQHFISGGSDPPNVELRGDIKGYSVDALTITGGCGIDFTDAPVGSGTQPAAIAVAPYVVITSGNAASVLAAIEYRVDELILLLPNQTTLNGILLNNAVAANIGDHVEIVSKADSAEHWSAPTGGTTAVWMPGWLNLPTESLGQIEITGFNVGIALGEHTRLAGPYVNNCNIAMLFFQSHDEIFGWVRLEQVPLFWKVDSSVSNRIPINIIADNETCTTAAGPCTGQAWQIRGANDIVDTGSCSLAGTGCLVGQLNYKIKNESDAYETINLSGGANLVYCNDGVAPVSGSCGTVITGAITNGCVTAADATHIQTPSANCTVDSSGNFGAASFNAVSDGVHAAADSLAGNTTVPALPSNSVILIGPNSASFTAYGLQFTSSAPTAGQFLKVGTPVSGITPLSYYTFVAPQVTVLTSGTGTYTTPAGTLYVYVRMCGGGGGGGGSGIFTSGNPGAGGTTTFGTTFLSTTGGGAGGYDFGNAGTPGSASGGDLNIGGGWGGAAIQATFAVGGQGASSPFGGGGGGGAAGVAGTAAATNSCGGGGGAGSGSAGLGGGGGSSGGYLEKTISSPSATYAYAVGGAGTAGPAYTGGFAGAIGSAGIVIIKAFFQ